MCGWIAVCAASVSASRGRMARPQSLAVRASPALPCERYEPGPTLAVYSSSFGSLGLTPMRRQRREVSVKAAVLKVAVMKVADYSQLIHPRAMF